MCGFVIAKSGLITTSSFKNALDKIQHRGPDDSKIVESHGFTFGFNRLSIQDLSEFGSQPMKDSQGKCIGRKLAVEYGSHNVVVAPPTMDGWLDDVFVRVSANKLDTFFNKTAAENSEKKQET